MLWRVYWFVLFDANCEIRVLVGEGCFWGGFMGLDEIDWEGLEDSIMELGCVN